MSDSSRLDSLELAVARLTKELVALRTEVRAGRTGATVTPEPPAASAAAGAASVDRAPVDASGPVERGPAQRRSADSEPRGATSLGAAPVERGAEGAFVSEELRRMVAAGATTAGGATATGRSSAGRAGAAAGRARATFRRQNLEALVGRYGTLALAAFTILMGIGAFIGWAVRNGLIGPELRVALGALAAVVVAGIGWRMRRGDSPRFGGVLLALALAILHVVCWGAGPLLQLVPNALALGVAGAASAALAALALRESDQSLFNVGFGGALLAPFVTSSETGDAVILLLYGAVVLGAGMRAMRDREWSKTPFVLALGIMGYTAAASGQLSQSDVWGRAGAPAAFGIATAWLSLILVQGKPRERLAVTALLAAMGALGAMHDRPSVAGIRFALAALATLSGFLVSTGGKSEGIVRAATALLLPFSGVVVALVTLADASSRSGVATTLLWATASAAAAVANRDGARQWHAFTATSFGGLAIVLQFESRLHATARALAGYGALAAVVMRQFSVRGVGVAAFWWLTIGAAIAFVRLADRASWLTNPFLTVESATTAAICAAWLIFSWNAARTGSMDGTAMRTDVSTLPRTLVRILGAVLTFVWIHMELSRAVSIDVSTFLLVAYYAVTGVLAIGVGRWRAIPLLRQLGLALSVFAAIKAMAETSALSIGWRVGGYLLAGVFLLGVAYWYRGTGGDRDGRSGEPEVDRGAGDAVG